MGSSPPLLFILNMTLDLDVQLVSYNGELNLKFTDNSTGYGTISAMSVTVVKPDGTTTGTYDIFSDPLSQVAVFADFSTGVESMYLTHTELFGTSGTLVDGNYDITFNVTDNTGSESQVQTLLAYKTVHDCIQRHLSSLQIPKCECKWDTLEVWMLAAAYMDTLKAQACLGEEAKFLNTLTTLQNICTLGDSNCQPCSC